MTTDTSTPTSTFDCFSTKLIACAIIVACLLFGLAGLILPLVPGLLFIAIAVFVAAKLSPRFASMVRENETLRGYLDQADRIAGVPVAAEDSSHRPVALEDADRRRRDARRGHHEARESSRAHERALSRALTEAGTDLFSVEGRAGTDLFSAC